MSPSVDSLSTEIRNDDIKNIIFNIVYRPPDGDLEVFENYFQSILLSNSIRNKSVIGDFNIAPNLANDIQTAARFFESYVQKTNETTKNESITINELKDTFFPLGINESAEYDEVSFNAPKKLLW